jgi:hypothetical protein
MDPDQTAQMHRLVWIHAGRKRNMLVSHGAAHLFKGKLDEIYFGNDSLNILKVIWNLYTN